MESLFSFGLYVEHIYGLKKSNNAPAIGFRFLDYPTVIINCNSANKSKNVSKQDENNNIDNENVLDDGDDDDEESGFYFGKGKSCLFKNNIEELCKLLNEIPLYVMIFDSTVQTCRLMGCCSIPLINLFNKMKKQVEVLGIDSPTATEEVDTFMVYNLMGVKTGELKLQLKLNFYGSSLLKHKNQYGKDCAVDTYLQLNNNELLNNCIEPDKLVNHTEDLQVECKPSKEVEDKGVQCISYNYGRLHDKRKKVKQRNLETFDEFHDANVYCPPPLFLNLYEKPKDASLEKPSSSPVLSNSKQSHLNDMLKGKYGSGDSISSLEEPYTEVLQPVDNRTNVCVISGNRKERPAEKSRYTKEDVGEVGNLPPPQVRSQEILPTHGNPNIIDISKLPLLSALSAEIARLTNFINKNDGELNVLNDNTSKQRQRMQNEIDNDIPVDVGGSYPAEKPICRPIDNIDHVNKRSRDIVVEGKNVKPSNINVKPQKGKLKFKSTRTQKLRCKYLKQSNQVTNENKITELPRETSDKDNWVKGLQRETSAYQETVRSIDVIPRSPTKLDKYELSTTVPDSRDTPVVKTNPGFYTPAEILQPELAEIVRENPSPSKLKKKHRNRSRGIESRGNESRGNESRGNNASSMYAYDTFSSEDTQDCSNRYSDSRSSSGVSQTSSISLPFSGRDSETSLPHLSQTDRKSVSQCSKLSDKSDKSLDRHSNASNKSNESIRNHSHSSDKSNKSSRQRSHRSDRSHRPSSQHSHTSNKSDKSSHRYSNASNKSDKPCSRYSNASDHSLQQPSDKSEKPSSRRHSNASDKPEKSDAQSDAPETCDPQLNASDSIEKIESSRLSSVKLERYMGDNSSASEKHTLDMLDDSRPGTQTSVNTFPDDSVLSPKHLPNPPYDEENEKDPNTASCFSPNNDIDELANTPLSPDNAMKPSSSSYSPRKSKHTAQNFQLSKRTHGLVKLEERPLSQLSGDTTMREIDLLLGDDSLSQLTSGSCGSSVPMTTDESMSPIGSLNIPQKYKHLNQPSHVHGLNKFDKRQVETVEEVDVSADEEVHSNMETLHEYEAYDTPKKSDFSPHQSKQFVQKKQYENVFRETLPPFSSNTNESSVDSGF